MHVLILLTKLGLSDINEHVYFVFVQKKVISEKKLPLYATRVSDSIPCLFKRKKIKLDITNRHLQYLSACMEIIIYSNKHE